jgi:[ribosomal protein S5]-alanine N-acetyltransferase
MPGRLRFRRVTADDLADVHRLHSDPETNRHNPYGADADMGVTRERLAGWLRHWDENGFGYELIDDESGCVGICGYRRDVWLGRDVLNLYWRLHPSVWGRGYALEAGRHSLDGAIASAGDELVVARMTADNAASQHIAERLGMLPRPDLSAHVDGAPWVVYAAPERG